MIRSPLRYPGGKFKALPLIMPLIPDDVEDFREPFFGGGSVTFGYLQSNKKRPKRITVGDLNTEIYNFWLMCQQRPEEVIKEGKDWFNRVKDPKELFDELKNVDLKTINEVQRAARQFVINRISFSGLGDSGTLSMDKYSEVRMEHFERITEAAQILQGIEIRNCSYEEILKEDGKNVFVFLDPPYFSQEGSKLYGKDGNMHTGFPHKQLAEDCKESKFNLLVTLDDCPFIRKIYKGLHIKPFKLTYTMAGKTSDDALAGEEIFIANYDIMDESSNDLLDSL